MHTGCITHAVTHMDVSEVNASKLQFCVFKHNIWSSTTFGVEHVQNLSACQIKHVINNDALVCPGHSC